MKFRALLIFLIFSAAICTSSQSETTNLTIFHEEFPTPIRKIFLEGSIPSLTFELLESDNSTFKHVTHNKLKLKDLQFDINSLAIMEVVAMRNSSYLAFQRKDSSYLEFCELSSAANASISCSTSPESLMILEVSSIYRIQEDKGYMLIYMKQAGRNVLQVIETESMTLMLSLDIEEDSLESSFSNVFIIHFERRRYDTKYYLCFADSQDLSVFNLSIARKRTLNKKNADQTYNSSQFGVKKIFGASLVTFRVSLSEREEYQYDEEPVIALFDGVLIGYYCLYYFGEQHEHQSWPSKRFQMKLPLVFKGGKDLLATAFYEDSLLLFSRRTILLYRFGRWEDDISAFKIEDLTISNGIMLQVIRNTHHNDIQIAGLLLEKSESFIFTLNVDEIARYGLKTSRTLIFPEHFNELTLYLVRNKSSAKEILDSYDQNDLILLKTDGFLTVYEAPERSYLQFLAPDTDEYDVTTQERKGKQRQYSLQGHTPLTFNSTNSIISSRGRYAKYSIDLFSQTIFDEIPLKKKRSPKLELQSDCISDIALNLNQFVSGTILNASFTSLNSDYVLEGFNVPFQVYEERHTYGYRPDSVVTSNGLQFLVSGSNLIFMKDDFLKSITIYSSSPDSQDKQGQIIEVEYFKNNETVLVALQKPDTIYLTFWELKPDNMTDILIKRYKIRCSDGGISFAFEPITNILVVARAGGANILQFFKLDLLKSDVIDLELAYSDSFYNITTPSVLPLMTQQQPTSIKLSTNRKFSSRSKLELDIFVLAWDEYNYVEYSKCTVELDLIDGSASRIKNDCNGESLSKLLTTNKRGIAFVSFDYEQPFSDYPIPSTPHVSIGFRNGNMLIVELASPQNASEANLVAVLEDSRAYKRREIAYWNRTTRTLLSLSQSRIPPYDCFLFAYVMSEDVDPRFPDPLSVQKVSCPPSTLLKSSQIFNYYVEEGYQMITENSQSLVLVSSIKDSSSYMLNFTPSICNENHGFNVTCKITVQNSYYNLTFEEIIYKTKFSPLRALRENLAIMIVIGLLIYGRSFKSKLILTIADTLRRSLIQNMKYWVLHTLLIFLLSFSKKIL